ncbi:MAG: hypothetical protein HY043_09445 [Verrucomicrobia bacterium]|nr:hypothetical protein [Verrucomicrobiota bacterium]
MRINSPGADRARSAASTATMEELVLFAGIGSDIRTSATMRSQDEPTHQFLATIQAGGKSFEKVLVKAYLPRRLIEPLRLALHPPKEQVEQLMRHFEFSLHAEVRGFTGTTEGVFEAKRIYTEVGTTKAWGMDLQESQIEAVPYDFAKWDLRAHSDTPQGEVEGRFWLTPSQLLGPAKSVSRSFTGEVKVKTVRQLVFTLNNGLCLSFDFVYRHFDQENGDHVSFSELVANFKDKTVIGSVKNVQAKCLDALDDFLLISSFAARHRCICLGWEAWDSAGSVTFYRRGLTIPKAKDKESTRDTLVDLQYFEGFIKLAYARFLEIEPKEYLRQALYAVTAKGKTVETKFTRLFSALETLVLKHRREQNTESIFLPEEWKKIREDLEKFIKQHEAFAGETPGRKQKRKQVYEKLPELNRISFPTAFTDFCQSNSIKLDDLWPVWEKQDTVSLAVIRNRLVHGEPFNHRQLQTLIKATDHLEWILERILLAVLGWSYANSSVSEQHLRRMTSYLDWKDMNLD